MEGGNECFRRPAPASRRRWASLGPPAAASPPRGRPPPASPQPHAASASRPPPPPPTPGPSALQSGPEVTHVPCRPGRRRGTRAISGGGADRRRGSPRTRRASARRGPGCSGAERAAGKGNSDGNTKSKGFRARGAGAQGRPPGAPGACLPRALPAPAAHRAQPLVDPGRGAATGPQVGGHLALGLLSGPRGPKPCASAGPARRPGRSPNRPGPG